MNTSIYQEQNEIDNNRFAKQIDLFRNEIIPVICDDMVEYTTSNGCKTIQDYIWKQYKNLIGENRDDIKHYLSSNYYYGITCLEQLINKNGMAKNLYETISEGFRRKELKLKDEIILFLKKGNFPLVITTLGFPVIESTVYKEDNSYKDYPIEDFSRWYHPTDRNDMPLASPTNHIVYHIFGGETYSSWVYNEQTLLKFMHSFHSVDYGAKNLFNRINKNGDVDQSPQQLLVLGSILPDWLFRFLIYPLYKDNISKSGGMWLSFDAIAIELSSFLERNNYTKITNIRQTVQKQLPNILNISGSNTTTQKDTSQLPPKNTCRIFISYKRGNASNEELTQLNRIVKMLESIVGIGHCWLDVGRDKETGKKNIENGDPYWEKIEKAINDSTLFIPIITPTYLKSFKNALSFGELSQKEKDQSFYKTQPVVIEAFYALSKGKRILPIVMKNSMSRNGQLKDFNQKEVECEVKKYIDKEVKSIDMDKVNLSYKLLIGEKGGVDMYLYDDRNPQMIELPSLNSEQNYERYEKN